MMHWSLGTSLAKMYGMLYSDARNHTWLEDASIFLLSPKTNSPLYFMLLTSLFGSTKKETKRLAFFQHYPLFFFIFKKLVFVLHQSYFHLEASERAAEGHLVIAPAVGAAAQSLVAG